jgi:hypothetical protein
MFFSNADFFVTNLTQRYCFEVVIRNISLPIFLNAWPLSSVLRFIVGDLVVLVGIVMNNSFTTTAVQRSRSWANFSECYWIWSIDYSSEHRHIPTLLSLNLQVAFRLCYFHPYSGIFICRSNNSSHAGISLLDYKRPPWKYTKIQSFGPQSDNRIYDSIQPNNSVYYE